MRVAFSKYQGTGNDFIIIDQMQHQQDYSVSQLSLMCDRRFGIGADGVMLLRPSAEYDFKMVYYNADGNESSMCGNGGRCLVDFARSNQYIKSDTVFTAIDGVHHAWINNDTVSLEMKPVAGIKQYGDALVLDTGSPHYVAFTEHLADADIVGEGRAIRYNSDFRERGINVNLTEVEGDSVFVRTYERGVEDETLSCGTGVTAAAIAAHFSGKIPAQQHSVNIRTRGGLLNVSFEVRDNAYHNIRLTGPAVFVFKGEVDL